MVDYNLLKSKLRSALDKETKESWDKFLDENKEELQKGFDMAISWGIEAYSIDKETGKIRCLSLEEAFDLKDNPNYEIVSIQDYSPEEVVEKFSEQLTSEDLESLVKPVLNIPSDANKKGSHFWLPSLKFKID